jgi:hypothetical protein
MALLLGGTLVVIVSVALALGGLVLVRRSVELQKLQDHHEVAGFFIGVLGVIYAVLLAFVVIVVWEEYSDASRVVELEANQLQDIYDLAAGFQPADRDRIQAAARSYGEVVVNDEWEAMDEGEHSPEADQALDELRSAVLQMNPAAGREEGVYGETLTRLSELSDGRGTRLHAAEEGLPAPLWVMLIAGAVITIGFTYFFGVESVRSQALMTAGLAAMIALALIMIFAINYPFRGTVAIDPGAFEDFLREISGG